MSGPGLGSYGSLLSYHNQMQARMQQQAALGGIGNGLGQAHQTFYGGSFGPAGVTYQGAFYPTPAPPTAEEIAAAVEAEQKALRALPNEGIRAGEVIAWRAWRVTKTLSGWRLQSLCVDVTWKPGTSMQGDPNFTPFGLPKHGIYAVKEADYARAIVEPMDLRMIAAVGEVALWGEIHEHEDGYRAENADIHSLRLIINWSWFNQEHRLGGWRGWFRKCREKFVDDEVKKVVQEINDTYGLECSVEYVYR